MSVTIYHNPACGTSRNVLQYLRDQGLAPTVIEYLKTPPGRATLKSLLQKMKMKPGELLRRKGDVYLSLHLDGPGVTDDQILDAMAANPILIERPIVVTADGARLCRPWEMVKDLVPG
jgi:arsenate reductase (glutaredoxin)